MVGSSSPEMLVARRLRCLAFVVSGGLPSVRGEERGKRKERDLSENVGRECCFQPGKREERVTSF